MLQLVELNRTYPPETIAVMTAAFDRVCQSLSTHISGMKAVRESLALIILRHVDSGEHELGAPRRCCLTRIGGR